MRKLLMILLLGALSMTACESASEKEKEAEGAAKKCDAPPTALAEAPELPPGFPQPTEVILTKQSKAGPSTLIAGYWAGDLTDAFDGYKKGFNDASYQVTKSEKDAHDAEIAFSGGNATGQVKLADECKGRESVSITIRPAG